MASLGCILWKIALVLPVLGLLYLVVRCPCKTVLCCHVKEVWLLIFILVVMIVANNGFRFWDNSCGGTAH